MLAGTIDSNVFLIICMFCEKIGIYVFLAKFGDQCNFHDFLGHISGCTGLQIIVGHVCEYAARGNRFQ